MLFPSFLLLESCSGVAALYSHDDAPGDRRDPSNVQKTATVRLGGGDFALLRARAIFRSGRRRRLGKPRHVHRAWRFTDTVRPQKNFTWRPNSTPKPTLYPCFQVLCSATTTSTGTKPPVQNPHQGSQTIPVVRLVVVT